MKRKAIEANLKLVLCPVRHLGTEKTQQLYRLLYDHLVKSGIKVRFNSPVEEFIINQNKIEGVKSAQETFYAPHVAITVGREGSDWLLHQCEIQYIPTKTGIVDIGVRLECRNEIMQEINENFYEAKLIHYTLTFDDKVRTFCSNPGGFVSSYSG